MNSFSKILIIIGLILITAGAVSLFFKPFFSWFGSLPGDIKIEKENYKLYFPITSMLIISIILNIVYWIFKFFK
ncbi:MULTISPECIES: DUF2905 domain-containing protein [unclassified Halanaerobium]|uniref:DUF2905 domain-containing protein n=1 Tax=unclassified Halanaerobium TaxID=2641197 RepID=UPI000DF20B7D|nr:MULTISPECIES: DUF2905 domain-containing protein [unclassified Halanaerobium]